MITTARKIELETCGWCQIKDEINIFSDLIFLFDNCFQTGGITGRICKISLKMEYMTITYSGNQFPPKSGKPKRGPRVL